MFSEKIVQSLSGGSFIRAMFEQGENLRKQYGPDKVFDFSLGNPDPEPPLKVKEDLIRLVTEDNPRLHGYMPNAGYADVREKVAAYHARETGLPIKGDHVVMTCGAGGALNVVLKSLLNPGEEVIVFAPFFMEYLSYISNYDGKCVIVPTDTKTFLPDAEALKAHITPRTKAIIINSPNNPTGVVYDRATLEKLAQAISEKEKELGITVYVISDEPYRKIVYDGIELPRILNIFKNSILVDSFSKSLSLPGERIGYIVANPAIENIDTLMAALIYCNRILGFVNAPALFQKLIADNLDQVVDIGIYKERRDLLYNSLTEMGYECIKPGGAFYLFPKSPIEDDTEFARRAMKYNLIIVPGSGFRCPGFFRLAYCVSMKTIENSLPAFKALLEEFR